MVRAFFVWSLLCFLGGGAMEPDSVYSLLMGG